ncbi:MAG: uracil-DNA glycosylase [Clostridiales bacterium]|nr:uracil-DNA glycosylase [Clostridiales bacterium]
MEKNKKHLKLNKLYSDYANEFAGEELVFGDGNYNSGIAMIGEAPGKDEVIQGKPFVGLAGGKLKELLDYIGLTREDLYVTNAIKYRLFKTNPKTNKKSNRPAKIIEIKSSMPYLASEMKLLNPRLIITLGNVPLKAITATFNITIGDVHGTVMDVGGLSVFPLYHPASLIYNRNLEETYYKDMDKLKIILRR